MTTAPEPEETRPAEARDIAPPPQPRSEAGAWRAWLRKPDSVEWIVIGIVGLALVMRLVQLGEKALHHDESLHAAFSYYFAEGRGYVHDPLMHGPFQFHFIAALFKLFGDGDTMA